MQNTIRKFKATVPVLLTTADVVCNNLEVNIDDFKNDYPQWTTDWISGIKGRVEQASSKVGLQANEQQREATRHINSISASTIDHLLMIKTQIGRGYRDNKARLDELLTLLGFHKNWKKARNNNQNALLELLETFDNHTSDELREELTGKGVTAQRIDAVKASAREMAAANVTQETLKSEAPVITAEMTVELNEIYNIVMDICNGGKIIFRNNPVKKALFNFSKLSRQQKSAGNNHSPQTGQ